MSYYHPRDFDAEQPVLQHLPAMRRFKSYAGLSRAFRKFEYWLNDFETVSLLQADKQTEWEKTKIISLYPFESLRVGAAPLGFCFHKPSAGGSKSTCLPPGM